MNNDYIESFDIPITMPVLECLAISDRRVFCNIMEYIGLPIIGIKNTDPLNKSIQSESVAAMASVLAEDVNDYIELDPERKAIKRMAEDYGYIVAISEKSPPGWKHGVESMKKKGMPTDKAFAIAWSSHNKGYKAPDTGEKPKKPTKKKK